MDSSSIGIWIDEPNAIFRRGMVSSLQGAGFVVAGESERMSPTPDFDRAQVLLFDLADGRVSPAVRAVNGSSVRLIGVARVVSEELLFDALEAGLAGFLVRTELTPERLIDAVKAVASGHGSVPPALVSRLLDGLARGGSRGTSAGHLTKRELSVLGLLAAGDNTRDVAEHLSYSERTVKNIIHDTLMKMNCKTRAHAVALATRQGVI